VFLKVLSVSCIRGRRSVNGPSLSENHLFELGSSQFFSSSSSSSSL
jgi:hypothetical protein